MRNLLGAAMTAIIGGFILLVIIMTALKIGGNPLNLIPIQIGR